MSKIRKKSQSLPRWLIIIGLLIAVIAILGLKEKPPAQIPEIAGDTPQTQLAQALEAGAPILAFYHSNNCKSCLDMIEIVNQVYPEFQDKVVLVDVNVYEAQNQALLQTVGLRYIPTQMLYHPSGEHQTVVGVMQPDQLQKALAEISAGK